MKFSQMPYQRPDLQALERQAEELRQRIASAASADEAENAYRAFDRMTRKLGTTLTLASIRHTIDTRDPFYDAENDFADQAMPAIEHMANQVRQALLASPFRPELERRLGKLLFTNLEIAARSFDPRNMELMQEENRLCSEYQKLYASAMVSWDGEQLPLPKLTPFKQSPDRAVRRRAFEVEGAWFDSHRQELDELYDALVKNRTRQARNMGYDNFLQLGYDRLGRNCYGPAEVAAFREQIVRDLVPITCQVRANQARRLGLDKLKRYDSTLLFPDGNAVPQGSAQDILAAGRTMYHQMSPETDEFSALLWDNELLDVLSKEGKAPGGYCTSLVEYKAPFIFSNFNGTSGDVDVLTHEAGHAFAGYQAMKQDYLEDLLSPTAEACEVHSMSMEFLTAPWHHLFFGPATDKYALAHCEDSLNFLPYGCLVDEFQHRMYEDPDLTPDQRHQVWLELERKYQPWMDSEDLPFYSRGATWQRQLHIFLCPLYYIDYCMAQTVAYQFWMASLNDRADAWARYLRFANAGGTRTFRELVEDAGLKVPYAPGCVWEVAGQVAGWLKEHQLH